MKCVHVLLYSAHIIHPRMLSKSLLTILSTCIIVLQIKDRLEHLVSEMKHFKTKFGSNQTVHIGVVWTDKKTDRQTGRHECRQAGRQTETDRQTGRQADRDKHADRTQNDVRCISLYETNAVASNSLKNTRQTINQCCQVHEVTIIHRYREEVGYLLYESWMHHYASSFESKLLPSLWQYYVHVQLYTYFQPSESCTKWIRRVLPYNVVVKTVVHNNKVLIFILFFSKMREIKKIVGIKEQITEERVPAGLCLQGLKTLY
jgi:hypothetical protein